MLGEVSDFFPFPLLLLLLLLPLLWLRRLVPDQDLLELRFDDDDDEPLILPWLLPDNEESVLLPLLLLDSLQALE